MTTDKARHYIGAELANFIQELDSYQLSRMMGELKKEIERENIGTKRHFLLNVELQLIQSRLS